MTQSSKEKRRRLREIIYNKETDFDTRLQTMIKLSEMPRNSSSTRIRNRCEISGRPRGFHRRFKMSRIALRELGSLGLIPGLTKSSW
jgi:small subunit ribosomal protein S14